MSDETFIRRTKLRKLGKTAKELAQLGIGGYSYWAAMLAENSTKNFGEKAARQLEEKLDLPRGWLDQPLMTQSEGRYAIAPLPDEIRPDAANKVQPSFFARALGELFDMLPNDMETRAHAFTAMQVALEDFKKKQHTPVQELPVSPKKLVE